MRQRGVFQVGVDLLDDRVPAVGFVRCDRVEDCRVGGGEERVEAPHVEQAVLTRSAVRLGGQVRDSAYHQPAGYLFGLRACRERGKRNLSNLSLGDPAAGGLVEDGVGVLDRGPRLVGNRRDRVRDGLVHPDRDRHRWRRP